MKGVDFVGQEYNKEVGLRLYSLRKSLKMTRAELGKKINLHESTIKRYEDGEIKALDIEKIKEFAGALETTPAYLMGWEDIKPIYPDNLMPLSKKPTKKVPLVGTIACGTPILAEQNVSEYIDMDNDIHADFALRCKGDSMINARIFDGDIVYIKIATQVENGEIAAVLIEDIVSEATLKRFYKDDEKIRLCAENPTYKDMVFYHEEINAVHVLGKAVAFLSAVK